MSSNEPLKKELKELLVQKRGKAFYAKKLGVSIDKINELLEEINPTGKVKTEDQVPNNPTNTINIIGYYNYPPKPEDVIRDHKIDTAKWKLASYWSKQKSDGQWQISALFCPIKEKEKDTSEEFLKFLKGYKPKSTPLQKVKTNRLYSNSCLIFNKQDSHYNKFSTKGDNDVNQRFSMVYEKTKKILNKGIISSNLQKIIYVLGSDQFNSEFTSLTTHGTPQQNIGTYEETFTAICDHEIGLIDLMLTYSGDIEILYIPANHDRNVSWHMVNWLKAYYRNNKNVKIDDSLPYSKYRKFSNTALMFNHGYKVKPEQLAQIFPIEFKKEWGSCDNYNIFVGDLHSELSKEIGGIQFFRLAQMSKATSTWDEERGYVLSKGIMTAFLVEENNGVTDTYREIL